MTHRRGVLWAATAGGALLLALAAASPATAATLPCQPGTGTDLHGQTLTDEQVQGMDLRCANLTSAHLDKLDLVQQDFSGAVLQGASLTGAKLGQANLTGANLSNATLSGADLVQATLTDANLSNAVAADTKFGQATMTGAIVVGLQAQGADFSQVDLTGLVFTGADLSKADLTQANLTDASLGMAKLNGADVTQARLTRTDFTGADLTDVNLGSAIDQTGAKLGSATGVAGTGGSGLGSFGSDDSDLLAPPAGPLPVDAFAAIMTLLLAFAALGPRLRSGASGRFGAWLVILATAAVVALEIIDVASGPGWQGNLSGILFFIIAFIPSLIILSLLSPAIRRPTNGWGAVVLAILGLIGYFTVLASSLAMIADGLYPSHHLQDCTAASCVGGAARGPASLGIGIVLIILVLSVGRRRSTGAPAGPQAAGQQSAQQYQAQLQASAPPQLQAQPWTQTGAPVQVQPAQQVRPSQAPTQGPAPSRTLPPGQPAQGTVILNGKPVSTSAPQKPPRWGGR